VHGAARLEMGDEELYIGAKIGELRGRVRGRYVPSPLERSLGGDVHLPEKNRFWISNRRIMVQTGCFCTQKVQRMTPFPRSKITLGTPFTGVPAANDPCQADCFQSRQFSAALYFLRSCLFACREKSKKDIVLLRRKKNRKNKSHWNSDGATRIPNLVGVACGAFSRVTF